MADCGACQAELGTRSFVDPSQKAKLRTIAPTCDETAGRIKLLEEACLFFDDLAVSLPDHAHWLWELAERLEREAAALASKLRDPSSDESPEPPADAAPFARQRRFRRWPVALEGRVYGVQGAAKALISELGEGGLKAATGISCRVGEEVVISWHLTPEHPFQITGSVRYRVADGIGIQFLDISPADRVRIQHFCVTKLKNGEDSR